MDTGHAAAGQNARSYITAISIITGAPIVSVLICDDRPHIRDELRHMLYPLWTGGNARCVPDGFALVDAHQARPADMALISVHPDSSAGPQAIALYLATYPAAPVIVVGSITDRALLGTTFCRGATGLLLWDPD